MPLVSQYWQFEDVRGFEPTAVLAQLQRLLPSPGLGSRLLIEAEAESIRHGCTNMSLQVGTTNQRAIEFYRRHGYSWRSAFRVLDKNLGAL